MHEMSIAVNIIDIAVETARKNNALKINEIVLDIGTLSGIETESLLFCYDSACKNTMAEGSSLKLNIIPAKAVCDSCGFEFETASPVPTCPICENFVLMVSGGRELKIKSINVD
jgi:hydrogenase nickel incorporation protein HypA/HybF